MGHPPQHPERLTLGSSKRRTLKAAIADYYTIARREWRPRCRSQVKRVEYNRLRLNQPFSLSCAKDLH